MMTGKFPATEPSRRDELATRTSPGWRFPVVRSVSVLCFLAGLPAWCRDVPVRNDRELRSAISAAVPGTRIAIAPGTYSGGLRFVDLRGREGMPIVISASDPENPPLFKNGATGLQLSNPAFVELRDLVFSGFTGNGVNIDDGVSGGLQAHHVVLDGLWIENIGPAGNKDAIKLSGLRDFEVRNCTIERWGDKGSGIDMVGCHRGMIEGNVLRHIETAGGSGVQCKGGSADIVIRKNRFEQAGHRAVSIGGSTGFAYFRPPLKEGDEHAEARRILVEGNTFIGSPSPVAFVGADTAAVRFNTIYKPDRWALRILQETNADGFVPCRNGEFTDNLIVFHSGQWASGGVNIGGNTAPETFKFERNWWYCHDRPESSRPNLPVPETDGVYGVNPMMIDPEKGDLRLQSGSPALKVGAGALREGPIP